MGAESSSVLVLDVIKLFNAVQCCVRGVYTCSAGSTSSATEEISVNVGTSGGGPLSLVLSLLTSSRVTLDLGAQVDLLQLAGNLLAGSWFS